MNGARKVAASPVRWPWRLPVTGAWWNTRLFVALAMAASTLPLLVPAVPPLVDLPGHIGRYRVMLGTDAAVLGRWYSFHWQLVGNLGTDLLVAALAPLIGLEPAVKLVVATIPPLTVLGICWTAREVHGRIHPFALFALPLAYGFPFQFGFVNYVLAIALGLNAFAGWLALGRLGRRRLRAALYVPLSVLLWLTHLVGWGAFGVLVLGAELATMRATGASWRRALRFAIVSCLPLALPLVLLLAWRSSSASGGETMGWARYDLKLSWLAMVLRDRWMAFDVASTALLYLILYKGLRDPRLRFNRTLAGSALCLLAVFTILPITVFGSAYADMRLAPLIILVALVALAPDATVSRDELAMVALGAVALFAARTIGTTLSYLLANDAMNRELAAIDHIQPGSVTVTMIGTTCREGWAMQRLLHLPGIALERRSIFANDQWLLAGAPLLRVDMPALGTFANDPSQLVLARGCPAAPDRMAIATSLAMLPRDAVDYLWLIAPPRYDPRWIGPARLVWRDGGSALYRFEHRGTAKRL